MKRPYRIDMEAYIISITKQALYLTLILTAPPVGAAMITGLVISLFQATTQIQEQTLTFVPKLVAVVLSLVLIGPWIMSQIVNFTFSLIDGFPMIVK